jgi:glycosyltransferase involved in cell wall biosynthesis
VTISPDFPGPVPIVHVITGLGIGGAEMMLWKLLARTNRKRFSPTVISLTSGGHLRERFAEIDVPVRVLSMDRHGGMISGWSMLVRAIRATRPEIIQGWMYHGNAAALFGSFFVWPRPKVVWNLRTIPLKPGMAPRATLFLGKAGGWFSGGADAIINNSSASRRAHIESLGYTAENHVVIPNGFDTQLFHPARDASVRLKSILGLATDEFLVGIVARFDPLKDHNNFFQAAKLVLNQGINASFLLVGHGVDDVNPQLKSLIHDLGLARHVRLLGARSDIASIVPGLDLLVSSSYSEAFPNSIGEAMSCGVPCVVTDVGDSAMIVGETGRVVPARDPRALAAAIVSLLSLPSSDLSYLRIAARRRIEEQFSIDAIADRYYGLYDALLQKKYPARRSI